MSMSNKKNWPTVIIVSAALISVAMQVAMFKKPAEAIFRTTRQSLWITRSTFFVNSLLTRVFHLRVLLPEDCIANITVLRRRLEKKKISSWRINLKLAQEIIYLLWAFYIRMPFENLMLPSDDAGDRQIDD